MNVVHVFQSQERDSDGNVSEPQFIVESLDLFSQTKNIIQIFDSQELLLRTSFDVLESFVDFRGDSVEECRNRFNYVLFRVVFVVFLFRIRIVILLTIRRDS